MSSFLAPQHRMHIDIETRSRVDLTGAGLAPYAEECDVLLIAYAFDDGPVHLWDAATREPYPSDLVVALTDPDVIKWAWNARFEFEILSRAFTLIEDQWQDSMAFAHALALPAYLGGAGAAVELDGEFLKMEEGKGLIKKFCVPREPTKHKPWEWCDSKTDPDDWRRFGHYCVRDVESERAIWHKLKEFNHPDHEWRLMLLDWKINRIGMPIDLELAKKAVVMDEKEKARLRLELNSLTGLENGNSVTQLMPWLRERGYDRDSLDKNNVKLFLRQNPDADANVLKALTLRAQVSSTSIAKYKKILDMVVERDGWHWLPNCFQWRGAGRTGRWAGRGVQWQNAARPKWSDTTELVQLIKDGNAEDIGWMWGTVTQCLSVSLRSTVKAPPGRILHINDFSAIEVWMSEWLTGCAALRAVLDKGQDPYKSFGETFLAKDHDDITKDERTLMKPVVLGGGYGLGGGEEQEDGTRTGLMGYAASMGVMLDSETSARQVKVYRDLHPEIIDQWYALERVFMEAISKRPASEIKVGKVWISSNLDAVRIRLPGGRHLNYYKPQLREMTMPWRDKNGNPVKKIVPTFMGVDQITKRFTRMPTRGAHIYQNINQGISSDVLAVALTRLDAQGFTIIGHIHDEVLSCEIQDDEQHSCERMAEIMTSPIDWAPGLHLAAEGGSSITWRKF